MPNKEVERTVINDPNAPNARTQSPDRSLQVGGVMTPHTPSAASLTNQSGLSQALDGVQGLLATEFEKQKDDWITEGKVAYQSGQTEQQVLASGNAFTAQGYHALDARDKVNNWFTQQTIALDTDGKKTDPAQYATQLKKQRSDILNGITDPNARKVAAAAFEDMSPRLASAQMIQNNEYNKQQSVNSFSSTLSSTAPTSATASKQAPGQPLAMSPVPVEAVMQPSARDRDVGIRTMLGEAANEGADGMAAVAHVLRNRATDGRWPDSIAGVALQPKQFSTFNAGAGGNGGGSQYPIGSPIYDRAGQVFDAVMSGKHVDPTGGATHYYSPAGMQKLVDDGDQSNVIPKWLDDETARGGGRIQIGGHVFVGKSSGTAARASVDPAPQVTATTLASGTTGDLNAVPAQNGQAVTGVAQTKAPNEIQQLIKGYGLPDELKATAVSDAMRRNLDAGDDTLFRDSGGIAMLHQLNAKPGEVDEVIKAKKRFDDKQLTNYSSDEQKFRDDVLARAEKGEDRDTILADIDKAKKSGMLNDAKAGALAASALDKIRAEGKEASKLGNVDMLRELGGLYQNMSTGGDFKTVAEQAKVIANKYGATEKDVNHIVGKMADLDQSYQNKLREEVKAAAKTKLEQDAITDNVNRSIAKGYGLDNVQGSIKVPTGVPGQTLAMTAQDYGIKQIKDKWGKQYSDAVSSGQLTPGQAKPMLEQKVALELQNHNVIDKEMSSQLQGALVSGNLVSKDGTVKEAATQAYDSWLTLKNTPGISPAYLAKLVPDEGTRNLLEHAYLLDGGTLSKQESLLAAHQILTDPNRDPTDKLNKDVIWKQKMDVDINKALLDRTAPSFLNALFDTGDRSERERILTNNKTAQNYVNARADASHAQFPNELAEVSLEKGIQDLQKYATPVMGNLIIDRPGSEIAKTMGVTGFGPSAVEDAISVYIRKNGAKIWGSSYTDQQDTLLGGRPSGSIASNSVSDKPTGYDRQSKIGDVLGSIGNFDRQFSPQGVARSINPGKFDSVDNYKNSRTDAPPVYITYDAKQGIISVDLYKDAARTQTLGNPKHFFVNDIGAAYAKEQTTPGTLATAWNTLFKGTAKAIKNANEQAKDF